jgi:1,4-dihydroxy-6-naphthoate synthase
VAEHAQEMDATVRQQHIELYVNRYSMDIGEEGERATRTLFERAAERGLFPHPDGALYLEREP